MRGAALVALAGVIVLLVPTFGSAGSAARVPIPKSARYNGSTSQGTTARIFVSRKGTRVGYTISANLTCENGAAVPGATWSTEGKVAADYRIRPKHDGTFSLNSSNIFELTDGWGNASARFRGRFRSAKVVSGTFEGHIDYFDTSGQLFTRCDSGLLTWSARRT